MVRIENLYLYSLYLRGEIYYKHLEISVFFFFIYAASVPSLTWLSSIKSEVWDLGFITTRENPYPRELPLVSHSWKKKVFIKNKSFYFLRKDEK